MKIPHESRDQRGLVLPGQHGQTKRGTRGLGLEAQHRSALDHLNGSQWDLVAEFTEVESGRRADRQQLALALAACRLHRATLLIAKIDRLSRYAAFLLNLRDAGLDFVAADIPDAPTDEREQRGGVVERRLPVGQS
jgi:hypothetical protein